MVSGFKSCRLSENFRNSKFRGREQVTMRQVITNLTVTVKVPFERVDEVSQQIIDLLAELHVYDGAKLEQSNATIDL